MLPEHNYSTCTVRIPPPSFDFAQDRLIKGEGFNLTAQLAILLEARLIFTQIIELRILLCREGYAGIDKRR